MFFADYTRTFGTNNLTISPNGSNLNGTTSPADSVRDTDNGQAATFVYSDATKGWINVETAEDTETNCYNKFYSGNWWRNYNCL